MDSPTPTTSLFRHDDNQVHFGPGETVFAEGDEGSTMFIVQEGEVELKVGGVTVERVGPGGVIGEMGVVTGEPRSASAIAASACTLASIDQARFQFMVQQTPFFAIDVMRVLAARLRRMNETLSRS